MWSCLHPVAAANASIGHYVSIAALRNDVICETIDLDLLRWLVVEIIDVTPGQVVWKVRHIEQSSSIGFRTGSVRDHI